MKEIVFNDIEYPLVGGYFSFERPIVEEYGGMEKTARSLGMVNNNFSMFEEVSNDDKWIVRFPDIQTKKPVFRGRVILFTDYWRVTETGTVHSEILKDPTWQDILTHSDKIMGGGLFLEALTFNKIDENNIMWVELVIGS